MLLRTIPPEKLNYNEVIELIQQKIPDIDQEVRRRYVRDVSAHRLYDHMGGIRWREWSEAVNAAMQVEIDQAYSDTRKCELFKEMYEGYIHPYASQFKTKADAMAEAYMVCLRLVKEWRIPEDQIHYSLKFVDIWDKERSWDAEELQKN